MDLDYAILADGVSARPDGKLDLFGAGFDTIFAAAVPARHPQLSLALKFLVTREEARRAHTTDVYLIGDTGQIAHAHGDIAALEQEQLTAVPAGSRLGLGAILNFGNLLFPAYGLYNFAVHWDGTEARTPIILKVAPLPVQQTG